jgi:hypothetical protein
LPRKRSGLAHVRENRISLLDEINEQPFLDLNVDGRVHHTVSQVNEQSKIRFIRHRFDESLRSIASGP